MRKSKIVGLCLLLGMLGGCAQVGTITGGEKDTKPPVILSQTPENNSTQFHGDEIHITFDEFVELVNPEQNFIISPATQEKPQYNLRGKSLIIDLKKCQLDSNTTYIINCKGGIKDYTEGNILPTNNIVFSTGDYIDSLSYKGNLKNAFTLENINEAAILLHTANEDSTLYNTAPSYVAFTDKNGNFEFSHLPNQQFYVSVISEKTSDFLYNQTDELVGFCDSMITPYYINKNDSLLDETSLPQIQLYAFQEVDTNVKFLRKEFSGNFTHKLTFKNKVYDFSLLQISSLDTVIHYLYEKNPTMDTLMIYFLDTIDYTFDFQLVVNGNGMDTISLNPGQKAKGLRQRKTDEPKINYLRASNYQDGNLFQRQRIAFNAPVKQYSDFQFMVVNTKDSLSDTNFVNWYFVDSIHRIIEIDYDFDQENTTYKILCPDSLIFDYYGTFNDSISMTITTKSHRDFSHLTIAYQFYQQSHYIVELLNEKGTVIQKDFIEYNQKIEYKHLVPGKYKSRVIVDDNNNGIWDCGNYLQRIQPEKVTYCSKVFEVLANWKHEETFDVVISKPE